MPATITRTLSLEDALQEAAKHHRAGRMGDAEALYKAILQAQPTHPDANHNLGVLEMQRQQFAAALPYLKTALDANPGYGQYWLSYAEALLLAGNVHGARQVLTEGRPRGLQGSEVDALLVRIDAALATRMPSSNTQSAEARRQYQQAELFYARGQIENAIISFLKTIESAPDWSPPQMFLGIIFNELGRLEEAEARFRRVLEIEPDEANGHFNLGIVLHRQKRLSQAELCFQQALRLRSDHASACNNLGIVLHEQGRFDEAEATFRRALVIFPEYAQVLNNLGVTLNEMDRVDEARQCFTQAIRIQPDYAEAWNNCGNALEYLGNFEQALAHYDQAVRLQPDYLDGNWNKALSELRFGHYEQAWPLYERRLQRWESLTGEYCEKSRIPRWNGSQALAGKSILLHAEQGLGDTLQFCRYALYVAERGAKVFLQVPVSLVTLLRSLGNEIEIVSESDALPVVDFHCPLMSLPLAFGTTLDSIPCDVPYLKCSSEKSAWWANRLGKTEKLRVGLVWSSGFRPDRPELWRANARRNMPLHQLAFLREFPNIEYISLQKGEEGEAQLHALRQSGWPGPEIRDFANELNDFSDTAALIDNLDLVLSVDTSTAHLAGAMGKPVWLMGRFDACWRWLLGRRDSPWYPTLTLFRQARPNDWNSVIEALAQALTGWLSGSTSGQQIEAVELHPVVAPLPKAIVVPLSVEALQRATELHLSGKLQEAREAYRTLLTHSPDSADILRLLGTIETQLGAAHEGWPLLERAIRIEPAHPENHNNAGNALLVLGRTLEALSCYDQAIRLKPDYAEAHANRADVLKTLGRLDEARQSYDAALRLNPAFVAAHVNRGVLLEMMGLRTDALASYEQALQYAPNLFEAHCNRGNILLALGRLTESIASFHQAARLQPENPDARLILGNLLGKSGDIRAGLAEIEQALRLRPDFMDAHWNRAHWHLIQGNYATGWPLYEIRWARWAANGAWPVRAFTVPRWQGDQKIEGKRILLYAEQGLGDTIQFSRYAPLLAARGAQVFLQVQAPLVGLLRSLCALHRGIEVFDESAKLPPVDFHCPLMSVPLACGTTLDSIPANMPYLRADPDKRAAWQHRLGSVRHLRVGLAWQSGTHANHPELCKDNARRDIPLKQLETLGEMTGVTFYSLQKDAVAARQLRDVQASGWKGPKIIDWTESFTDFTDTAALIDGLDLVISVDTAVAHLAGALGKPLWVLLRFDACWRWLLDRRDSPWYPTAKLMRQETIDDWRPVIENMARALENWSRWDEQEHGLAEALHVHKNGSVITRHMDDATRRFEPVPETDADDAQAHRRLSLQLLEAGRWREAENGFRHVLRLKPDDVEARASLGRALMGAGRVVEAEQYLRESLLVCPDSAILMSELGVALMTLDKTVEAEEFLRRAITQSPHEILPLANALMWLDYRPDDPCFAHLQTAYDHREQLDIPEQIHLNFSMACAMASMGDGVRAFEACTEGNRLRARHFPYDENMAEQFLEKVRNLYSAERMIQLAAAGAGDADTPDSCVPVFIVGLPDSGGHFIGQVLSRHPDVLCVADQRAVDHLVDSVSVIELMLPDASRQGSNVRSLRNLGRMYLEKIQRDAGKAKFIVNTVPDHYLYLGLIHLMLPNAKIIHALRDPLETCLSCYATLFNAGHDYSYELGAMGRHYAFYRQLMQHWQAVLPEGRVLDVCYETHLVFSEAQERRLYAHVGLSRDNDSAPEPDERISDMSPRLMSLSGQSGCASFLARHPDFSWFFDPLREMLEPWRRPPEQTERQALLAAYETADYPKAVELARGMMEKYPWHVSGWQILGVALMQLGETDEALKILQYAVWMEPGQSQAHYNLGVVLRNAGRLEEAISCFQQALEIRPAQFEAHYNLGITLSELGDFPAAEHSLREALALKTNDVDTLNNLGIVLHEQGCLEQAEAVFQQGLAHHPEHVASWNNLGLTLKHLGRMKAAVTAFRQSIALQPDYLSAYDNLGLLLIKMRRTEEAEQCFQQMLTFAEDTPEIYCGLGSLYQTRGEMQQAVANFRRALELAPHHATAYSSLLFCLCHDADVEASALFEAHRAYADIVEAPWKSSWPKHNDTKNPDRILEIGFVSADFNNHPVASFFEPVLAHLAQSKHLRLHAYYNEVYEDNTTHRLKPCFSAWNPVAHLTDAALFDNIRADGIDILIDLSGHTSQNRLACFARKPALIQASWLGYSGTTGLQAMDYYFASEDFLPHEPFDHLFTEKILHLPAPVPFSPDPHVADIHVSPLPALENGYLTFGSFHRPNKIGRAVVALWSELLRQLPTSRLILLGMNDLEDAERFMAWFEAENIETERLEFVERCSLPDYFAYYQQIDLCLDAFPFNGSSTTRDALWMGVPTLTLEGSVLQSRAGGAWLRHFGLGGVDGFVAETSVQFVSMGGGWAQRLPELSRIRAGLRTKILDMPSCRPESIAQALVFALRTMWQRECAGQTPTSFEISSQVWRP